MPHGSFPPRYAFECNAPRHPTRRPLPLLPPESLLRDTPLPLKLGEAMPL